MHIDIKDNNLFSENTLISNFLGNPQVEFKFKEGLRSVDLPSLYFINYVDDNELANFIKDEAIRFKKGDIDILTEYKEKPIGMKSKILKRLNEVFYETYYYKTERLPYMKRLSNNYKKSFQMYYSYSKNNNIVEVVFIDLYHLLIPAANKKRKETKANPEKYYKIHTQSNTKIDIKDLLQKS